MMLAAADQKPLLTQLDRLTASIEELLQSGLTTASEATRQALGVTFQEASRLKLLRLGGTLRVANEELGRFTRNDPLFSQRRLLFFLNRSWLLSRGLAHALREQNEEAWNRLSWTPPSGPVAALEVVTLGVTKKVAQGAFCAFEFRLRTVTELENLRLGTPLTWSVVFPLKGGTEVPAEAFLHLTQEQKFNGFQFLERKRIRIEQASLVRDETATARITLSKESKVTIGEPFSDWRPLFTTNLPRAIERIRKHEPHPFELDVELQEEVCLESWLALPPQEKPEEGRVLFPIQWHGAMLDGIVSSSAEGTALRAAMEGLSKQDPIKPEPPPPLYGVLHYESCRLIFQPLTALTAKGPEYLTISKEKIDRSVLIRSLKLT